MKVKVCGMKYPGNIMQLCALPVDMIGFIFHERSPRYAGALPASVSRSVPSSIRKVGVFVDERVERVLETVERHELQMVQLHGSESPACCRALREHGVTVIKALPVEGEVDTRGYEGWCDYLLFDTKTPDHGGSGRKFDWRLLPAGETTPFLLGGGIGPGDAPALRRLALPALHAVDLNSRFETAPGMKDIHAIENFITILQQEP